MKKYIVQYSTLSLLLSGGASLYSKSPHSVLKLSPSATVTEIKKACKKARLENHADKQTGTKLEKEEAAENYTRVNEACATLLNKTSNQPTSLEIIKNKECVGCKLEQRNFAQRDFENGNFTGSNMRAANFNKAILRKARFEGAHIEGASFQEAHLEEAILENVFGGCLLPDAHKLQGCTIFDHAHLERANLKHAYLLGASFKYAHLNRAHFGASGATYANFEGANLTFASFGKADLSFASFGIRDGNTLNPNKPTAILQNTNFYQATLTATDFINTHINQCSFKKVQQPALFALAHITDTSFQEAVIPQAVFERSVMNKVSFKGADLRKTNFKETALENIEFDGAILDEADFSDARFGQNVDISKAASYEGIILPSGITIQKPAPTEPLTQAEEIENDEANVLATEETTNKETIQPIVDKEEVLPTQAQQEGEIISEELLVPEEHSTEDSAEIYKSIVEENTSEEATVKTGLDEELFAAPDQEEATQTLDETQLFPSDEQELTAQETEDLFLKENNDQPQEKISAEEEFGVKEPVIEAEYNEAIEKNKQEQSKSSKQKPAEPKARKKERFLAKPVNPLRFF